MAFKNKQDYFGLGSIDGLTLVSTAENKSSNVAEATDEAGFVVATEKQEDQMAPSCDFIVTNEVELSDIVLGEITAISNKNYVLGEISISTSAGSPVTVSCSGMQVEDVTNFNSCTAELPSVTLSPLHHAQTFGAFTISGTGAHLIQSTFTASSTVSTATKNNQVLAHDITDARITVTGTIQVSSSTYAAPTITPSSNWVLSSPLTETNPDGDFPTYTFTLTSYLSAIEPTNS